jgi:hypothetical protein
MIRDEVDRMCKLGPLPAEESVSPEIISKYEKAILSISRPISDDEARILITLFGPDGCFGLALALVRLVESAPGWPLADVLANPANAWIEELRSRVERANLR